MRCSHKGFIDFDTVGYVGVFAGNFRSDSAKISIGIEELIRLARKAELKSNNLQHIIGNVRTPTYFIRILP